MTTERNQPPIPQNWKSLLTEDQRMQIESLFNFGWYIYFIRRPMFLECTVVLKHDDLGYRLLEADGTFVESFHGLREDDFE